MERIPVERSRIILQELLEHLENACDDAADYDDAKELEGNRRDCNSVAMEFMQAQECANRLDESTRKAMPDIPWRELRAMRNVIVHEYGNVDWQVLYDTVKIDVPPVIAELRSALDSTGG